MSQWITASEAASILGVTRVTVWRWVQEGRLTPLAKLGRQSMFDRDYIEREARKREPLAARPA